MVSFNCALPVPATGAVSTKKQCELAQAAEDAGYEHVLVPETWGREAFARLGYFAANLRTIGLGTGIIPVHSRSPALIAQAGATIDELTDGCTLLGLGLSGPAVIENWHGIEFEPALRRQRETIEIVRLALSGKEIEYEGRLFDLEHFRLRFSPSRTDLEIYVAAQGETNAELAGGFGDGWMPNRIPYSALPDLRKHVDRGARMQDRDPADIATAPYVTTCILKNGAHARDRCRRMIAFYVGAMGKYHFNAISKHGFREVANVIRDNWKAGNQDAAREAVTDELLDEIAIAGSPEDVRDLFGAYGEIADTLVTLPPTTANPDEIKETVDHVGDLMNNSGR